MRPDTFAPSIKHSAWSKRLESVRKDVECTAPTGPESVHASTADADHTAGCFGRLKARWRCLRVPSMFMHEEYVENQMKTAVCLHNELWRWSGNHETRQAEVAWLLRQVGLFDAKDEGRVQRYLQQSWTCEQGFDTSGRFVRQGEAADVPIHEDRTQAWACRRDRLVEHFHLTPYQLWH